jgi:hypothetical protein
MYQVANTQVAERATVKVRLPLVLLPPVPFFLVGGESVLGLAGVALALRNNYVSRYQTRLALSQIKDGSHTCVYGGKWGKDLVEVVRI